MLIDGKYLNAGDFHIVVKGQYLKSPSKTYASEKNKKKPQLTEALNYKIF